ncbi:hypothetical protein Tco_0707434 [Tanacetum coccineum]|uniref:Uncharacterized protein n=1 Tax=Tanacetum coccineum TaxID=301880 RepID=A0ABQ4YA97_9ASTR
MKAINNDSSYGVNTQEGKGTTGIVFYYGESPISWSTQKQATVALSSCESEFIAEQNRTQAIMVKRIQYFTDEANTSTRSITSSENALKEKTFKSDLVNGE